ncbi:MAG TPA: outer membrane protein assembly factor BamD [Gammaproteobacteria bacterium]|nr:outer membrane protein assembly factor BamD [Gammaproteobacteria bacterium]
MARKNSAYFIIFLGLLLLQGCSSEKVDPYQDWTAPEIFLEAETNLKAGKYERAIDGYQSLDAQYPFGDYTEQAQLSLIYAHYRLKELPAALIAADRFIRLHPRHPDVDYAYYMRGMIKSTESISTTARILPVDLTLRDPSGWQAAYSYYAELLRRYPNSRYATDTRQRMIALRNDLAQYEINVAEYYLERKIYLAAAARAQIVIKDFPQTPQRIDALSILVISYRALGIEDLAEKNYAILELNDPERAALLTENEDEDGLFSIFHVGD